MTRFNARWNRGLECFRTFVGAPWWAPGLVLTPNLRGLYERCLPVADVCHDLAKVAACVLPHPSWIPHVLRTRQGHTQRIVAPGGPLSVPDLWQLLPTSLAGHLTLTPHSFPALLCALADPPHFGTATQRYPEQLGRLERFVRRRRNPAEPVSLLDLGCGVGHGTLEAMQVLRDHGSVPGLSFGCTREPLEAWMANTRQLPHAPQAQHQLRSFPDDLPVHFVAADALHIPLRNRVAIVVCNGLAGGTFLYTSAAFHRLLQELERCLAPRGIFLVANRFHDGRRQRVDAFLNLARQRGWSVEGSWRDCEMRRP